MHSVELGSNFDLEKMINIHEHEAADNCFLIFIGGKYVQALDQVMNEVESISKKIGLKPLGLFVTEENNSKLTNYPAGTNFTLVMFFCSLILSCHFQSIFLDIQLLPCIPG